MPRAGRPDAADVSVRVAADGVVPRLPSRARKISETAQRSVQHALSAAHRGRARRRRRRQELHRSDFPGQGADRPAQTAQRAGHHQLRHLSSISIWTTRVSRAARREMDDLSHKAKREDVCPSKRLNRATVEAQLAQTTGPEYWRSLEELAGSAEFQEMLHREFPKGASEWVDSFSRRGFLQLMGASLALAGMTGCTKLPLEPIVPYVRQPEQLIPGRPLYYATAFTLSGYASPVLVESHLGRPTKIEGNDKHPASLGGTDIFTQASILGMYDPDRSQTIAHLGDVNSWSEFVKQIKGPLAVQKGLGGAGIRILTQTISSPSVADQLRAFLKLYPQAKWHVYEPVNRDNVLEGAKLVFGQPVETQYR